METIRLGLIGCGGMMSTHVIGVKYVEHVEIVAVCDIIEEKAQKVADALGGTAKVFTKYVDMVDMVDAVMIALPHDLHFECGMFFAMNNKHVLMEKPLCNTEREQYVKIWSDIGPFVKYACMRDKKFYDRVRKAIMLTLTDGSAKTLDEYLEAAKQSHENTVYYATDTALQAQYVSMFESQGIEVAVLEHAIDTQFITMAEQLGEGVRFVRVDADLADALKGDGEISESEQLREVFADVLPEGVELKFDALRDESIPVLLNVSEDSRRVDDMMRMYRMGEGASLLKSTLVLNTASPLVKKLSERALEDRAVASQVASYLYKLSLLTQKKFSADEMRSFMSDSVDILMKL